MCGIVAQQQLILCMTAAELDGDSTTRWFTEVGVLSKREQPYQHSRQLEEQHQRSRHMEQPPARSRQLEEETNQRSRQVHCAAELPASRCSDGPAHKNPKYSQHGEVQYRASDGQVYNSSDGGSGRVVFRVGQNRDQQHYIYQGGRPDEDITVEPAYLPYYEGMSQSQSQHEVAPVHHSTDYSRDHPSISLSNQCQQLYPMMYSAMPQSHQQITVEPNKDYQQSGTAQMLRQFRRPQREDASDYQTIPQPHKNVSKISSKYVPVHRAGAQSNRLQHHLPTYQGIPQSDHISEVVYRAMPLTHEGNDRQNQHIRTDMQRQLTADNLPYSAGVGFAIQVPDI